MNGHSASNGSSEPFWTPSPELIASHHITKFREYVNKRFNLDLQDYWALHAWSVGNAEEMNDFWTAVWDFTGVVGDNGEAPVS